jgi:hypothetical protein
MGFLLVPPLTVLYVSPHLEHWTLEVAQGVAFELIELGSAILVVQLFGLLVAVTTHPRKAACDSGNQLAMSKVGRLWVSASVLGWLHLPLATCGAHGSFGMHLLAARPCAILKATVLQTRRQLLA